jgi:nucleoside-diphosphate-sugar epimerase
MRVFVTGATGFIGTAIVQELIGAGHQVVGLARSDAAADSLAAAGAAVARGSLQEPDSLHRAAAASDGVIHCAFIHDFTNYSSAGEADRRAIETIGAALAGTDRPFVVTAGVAFIAPGRVATELDVINPDRPFPRVSEETALALVSQGVRASVVRLPPSVHGDGDHGFVPALIAVAREKGVSAYVGEGLNRWSAVHRLDAAQLFRLALEKAPAGARLHGVGDEGVPFRQIASVIGRHLNVPVVAESPEEAADNFGWLGNFVQLDCPASCAITQESLGWHPSHRGLLADLDSGSYFQNAAGNHPVSEAVT